jgi:hypothetical protein
VWAIAVIKPSGPFFGQSGFYQRVSKTEHDDDEDDWPARKAEANDDSPQPTWAADDGGE